MGRPWCRFACESDTKGENCLGESFCSGHPSQKKGREKISVNEKPTLKLIETTEKNNREPARANCEDVWDHKEVRQEKKKLKKKNKENDRKLERDPECFFFLRYCCVRKCVLLRRGKTVKNVNNKEAGEQKSFVEKSAEPRSGKLAGKILKKKKTPSSLCALFFY